MHSKVSLDKVRLNIFSYYFKCWCKQTPGKQEAVKAYEAARDYIRERLDVKFLLDHFERFDSLCEAVLTAEQKEALKK